MSPTRCEADQGMDLSPAGQAQILSWGLDFETSLIQIPTLGPLKLKYAYWESSSDSDLLILLEFGLGWNQKRI